MFHTTQSKDAKSYLKDEFADIKTAFGIDWLAVKWEDLRMPFYSGLAARLYVHYVMRNDHDGIPRDVEGQGDTWVKYYRPGGSSDHFVSLANQLDKGEHSRP